MRTFLIALGIVYAAAALCLMAVGAYCQLTRWWVSRRNAAAAAPGRTVVEAPPPLQHSSSARAA